MRRLRLGLNDKQGNHEQEGQSLAGAPAAAEPGSSAQAGAGLSRPLRPDAAEFFPTAEKAIAAGPGSVAAAPVKPVTGNGALSPAAQNGVVQKRTLEAAGLQSCASPEARSPKAQRSMDGHAGSSAAEMRRVLVPNGQPVRSPGQQGDIVAEQAAGLQKALSAKESGEITLA